MMHRKSEQLRGGFWFLHHFAVVWHQVLLTEGCSVLSVKRVVRQHVTDSSVFCVVCQTGGLTACYWPQCFLCCLSDGWSGSMLLTAVFSVLSVRRVVWRHVTDSGAFCVVCQKGSLTSSVADSRIFCVVCQTCGLMSELKGSQTVWPPHGSDNS